MCFNMALKNRVGMLAIFNFILLAKTLKNTKNLEKIKKFAKHS